MTFAERAKPLKDKGHVTLKQIAEACNISESMVSRYLNGQTVPPEDIARAILDFLQASVEAEAPQTSPAAPQSDMGAFYAALLENQRSVYDAALADAKTDKRRWFAVSIALIAFLMFLLGWDITHPDMGYIRY